MAGSVISAVSKLVVPKYIFDPIVSSGDLCSLQYVVVLLRY